MTSSTLQTRHIRPQSGGAAFSKAITALVNGFAPAARLGWLFFLRDLRAEHRQSLLGYVWFVVPALANTAVWVFLNQQGVIRIDTGAIPYTAFVLVGTALWTAINNTVMIVIGVVNGSRNILAKVNFPHESLIYSAILKASVDAAMLSGLAVIFSLGLGVGWTQSALLFPLAVVAALVLGAAIGLACLPFATLYGDVSRAIQLLLRFAFFLTPVIYPVPPAGAARSLIMINPATPIIVAGRAWLLGSSETMAFAFVIETIAAGLVFALALVTYKVALPHLVERLGS